MKFGRDLVTRVQRNFTSWKSLDDPAVGDFTAFIDTRGFPQMVLTGSSEIVFRAGKSYKRNPELVDQRVLVLPHAIRLRIKMSQLCILASLNHCTSKLQMGTRPFEDIGSHRTKLLVYNLWLNDEGIYELDFDEDDEAYVSMLYLRKLKNFKIFLRGEPVTQFNIADELKCREVVTYSPQVSSLKAAIVETTLGFIKVAPALPITGFNIYHKNRLIRYTGLKTLFTFIT
ncbi:hypothetical protein LXL04_034391 [Taraxacum kok-saghyz]